MTYQDARGNPDSFAAQDRHGTPPDEHEQYEYWDSGGAADRPELWSEVDSAPPIRSHVAGKSAPKGAPAKGAPAKDAPAQGDDEFVDWISGLGTADADQEQWADAPPPPPTRTFEPDPPYEPEAAGPEQSTVDWADGDDTAAESEPAEVWPPPGSTGAWPQAGARQDGPQDDLRLQWVPDVGSTPEWPAGAHDQSGDDEADEPAEGWHRELDAEPESRRAERAGPDEWPGGAHAEADEPDTTEPWRSTDDLTAAREAWRAGALDRDHLDRPGSHADDDRTEPWPGRVYGERADDRPGGHRDDDAGRDAAPTRAQAEDENWFDPKPAARHTAEPDSRFRMLAAPPPPEVPEFNAFAIGASGASTADAPPSRHRSDRAEFSRADYARAEFAPAEAPPPPPPLPRIPEQRMPEPEPSTFDARGLARSFDTREVERRAIAPPPPPNERAGYETTAFGMGNAGPRAIEPAPGEARTELRNYGYYGDDPVGEALEDGGALGGRRRSTNERPRRKNRSYLPYVIGGGVLVAVLLGVLGLILRGGPAQPTNPTAHQATTAPAGGLPLGDSPSTDGLLPTGQPTPSLTATATPAAATTTGAAAPTRSASPARPRPSSPSPSRKPSPSPSTPSPTPDSPSPSTDSPAPG